MLSYMASSYVYLRLTLSAAPSLLKNGGRLSIHHNASRRREQAWLRRKQALRYGGRRRNRWHRQPWLVGVAWRVTAYIMAALWQWRSYLISLLYGAPYQQWRQYGSDINAALMYIVERNERQ